MFKKTLKAIVCIIMSLAIITCCLSGAYAAESSATVTVGFYDDEFIYYSENFTVSQGTAASYGYDSDASGVTVLDVLVALHSKMLSDDFTTETSEDFLTVSSAGFIKKVFGESASSFSFAVNGTSPNDGVFVEAYNGYTGLTCNDATVKSGDKIMFMTFKDGYWSDYYTDFDKAEYTATENDEITLTVTGYSIGWYGCSTAEYIASVTENMAGTDILLTSDFINYESLGKTDENGQLTFTVSEEGSCYLVTGGIHDGDYGETPVIGNTASLVVSKEGSEQEQPIDPEQPTEPDPVECEHKLGFPCGIKINLVKGENEFGITVSLSLKCLNCKETFVKSFSLLAPQFIVNIIKMIPSPIK